MSAQLELVFTARDEALQIVTEHADDWDKSCVDAVLYDLMAQTVPWSANDARELIAARSRHLLSARLNSFRLRGLIEKVGEVVSTDVGTHGKKIATYLRSER